MTTYPISPPALQNQATEKLSLYVQQAEHQSPFSLKTTIIDQAAQWILTVDFVQMTAAELDQWAAFVLRLRGAAGNFTWTPWRRAGYFARTGITLSATGNSGTSSLSMAGFGANSTDTPPVGTWFQVGSQLLRTTTTQVANGSGVAVIDFAPALRATVASGAAVEFAAPVGIFRLASGQQPGAEINADEVAIFDRLTASEVV